MHFSKAVILAFLAAANVAVAAPHPKAVNVARGDHPNDSPTLQPLTISPPAVAAPEPETRGGQLYSRDAASPEPETRGGQLYSSGYPLFPI